MYIHTIIFQSVCNLLYFLHFKFHHCTLQKVHMDFLFDIDHCYPSSHSAFFQSHLLISYLAYKCNHIVTLSSGVTHFLRLQKLFRNAWNNSHADDACVVAVHLAHPLALLPLLHRLVRGLDLQGRLFSSVRILESANQFENEGTKLFFGSLKSLITPLVPSAKNQRFLLCNVKE